MSRELLIAVIDDDESFRSALIDSLLSLGYDADGYASAEDFVGERQRLYDCIVTDIHMPGMSGFDLQRLLDTRGPRTPIIMVTARTEPNLEARAAAGGATCLLRKPFETDALIQCLERALKT